LGFFVWDSRRSSEFGRGEVVGGIEDKEEEAAEQEANER
jgi:hypothetical protein